MADDAEFNVFSEQVIEARHLREIGYSDAEIRDCLDLSNDQFEEIMSHAEDVDVILLVRRLHPGGEADHLCLEGSDEGDSDRCYPHADINGRPID